MKHLLSFLVLLLPIFCSAQFYEQEIFTTKNTYVESNFDGLGFSIIQIYQMPINGTLTIDSSAVSTTLGYQPDLDFVGRDTLIADISADALGIPLLPVMVIFVVEDTDPNAVDDAVISYPGFPITVAVGQNDNFFGSDYVITLLDLAQNGIASVDSSQNIVYTSGPNFIGTEILDYQICNINNICDTATLSIQIDTSQVQAFIQEKTIEQDMSFIEDFSFYSSLGITLDDYIIEQSPSHGSLEFIENENYVDPITGISTYYIFAIKYTPDPTYIGEDSYAVLSCTNYGECFKVILNIDILSQGGTFNTLPDFTTQYANAGSFIIHPLLNDTGIGLNITNIGSPAVGNAVLLNDNSIEYTISSNFSGNDSLTYTVCDYVGNCATENIYLTIDSIVTNPPSDNNFFIETYKNTPLYFDFSSSPIDQFNILTAPTNGTLDFYPNGLDVTDPNTGILQSFSQVAVYTPFTDYIGSDTTTAQVVLAGFPIDVVIQIDVIENLDSDLNLRIVDMGEQMNGVVSTNELEKVGFDLFPNPVTDMLYVKTDQNISNIRIIDMLGTSVLFMENNELDNTGINVSGLNQGTYVIQVEIEREFYNSIFIKK